MIKNQTLHYRHFKFMKKLTLTLIILLLAGQAWGEYEQLDKIAESVTGRGVYITGNYF